MTCVIPPLILLFSGFCAILEEYWLTRPQALADAQGRESPHPGGGGFLH